jgi:hypothetical protein
LASVSSRTPKSKSPRESLRVAKRLPENGPIYRYSPAGLTQMISKIRENMTMRIEKKVRKVLRSPITAMIIVTM